MKKRILVVDDEQGIRKSLAGVLEDEGYEVRAVARGEDCLEALGREAFELVLLDVWLPDLDGLETLRRLNDIGRVSLRVTQPLFHDAYSRNRQTGGFILIDETTNNTVAAGLVA